jgi:LPS-assembly lipoprotein
MNFKIKTVALICLSIMMIACGFQLRGSVDADFKSIYVYGGSEGLNKHLIKRFRQSGIKIEINNPEKILEILNDQLNKRILSLNSSGTVKEYELTYYVSYRFKSNDDKWSSQYVKEVSRDYTYDDNDRVAKELEEKNIVQGMRDEIVRSIESQISVSK